MTRTFSALLLLLGMSSALNATDFYVSPTGNNALDGTSEANAWATIQHACENATPGSTVYIKGGTYHEELTMSVSGTEMNYITFRPFENDEVIVDGTEDMVSPTILLKIQDRSYIRIEGLNFRDASGEGATGIYITGASNHIDIVNNEVSNIIGEFAVGVLVNGTAGNVNIEGNDIHDVHFSSVPVGIGDPLLNANPLLVVGDDPYTPDPDPMNPPTDPSFPVSDITIDDNTIHDCRTGYSEGLTLTGNVDGFSVTNNILYNLSNIGIDIAGGYVYDPMTPVDPEQNFARNGLVAHNFVSNWNPPITGLDVAAGIYVDGGRDNVIEHNKVTNYGRGYEIGCEVKNWTTSGIILRNNIAYGNRQAGIGIGGYNYPATTGKVTDCQVLNNTCYHNSQAGVFVEGELVIDYTENCAIKNNIFYAKNVLDRLLVAQLNSNNAQSVGLILDYNLYNADPFTIGGNLALSVQWYNQILTNITFQQYVTTTMSQEAHSIYADPKFIDASIQDFHLGALSPAFDKGDPTYMPMIDVLDMDDELRVLWTKVDIGADEAAVNLPVEYSKALYGRAVQTGIDLRWATANEHNAARFDIERSPDGASFEKIGAVAAKGNSSAPTDYYFQDKHPLRGINYYRLKQVDLDGRANYSQVVQVNWEASLTGIYPNPTTGAVQISSAAPWEKVLLKNHLGQLVKTLLPGQETTLQGLENGMYQLEVYEKEGGVPQVFKVVKQ
ncbi:MAG: right-handed parallel beta-helix repeat-containing protein [Bacteroidetes bacterium]|nr:right-handed parallel beta-helix repeat-containing protein [Bacteroidota bacterium]